MNDVMELRCSKLGADLFVLFVQYPRLFSLGTFSKTGPTRKQVSTCRKCFLLCLFLLCIYTRSLYCIS